jgi:hypothetical protein
MLGPRKTLKWKKETALHRTSAEFTRESGVERTASSGQKQHSDRSGAGSGVLVGCGASDDNVVNDDCIRSGGIKPERVTERESVRALTYRQHPLASDASA